MDLTMFHSVFTVVMFVIFVGICAWAWSGRRKADFQEAAMLPFDDETVQVPARGESGHE